VDDLQMLATLLAKPEPSGDVVDRGRRRLRQAMEGPARRHRARWLAGGLGLTAAAAAIAVAVASGLTAPAGTRSRGPAVAHRPAVARLSGRQILLAAAATAQTQRSGTYWHFKITIAMNAVSLPKGASLTGNTYDDWVGRGNKYWASQPRCAATPGTVVLDGPGWVPWYYLGDTYLTYQQTQHLPASPAGLEAWLAHRVSVPARFRNSVIAGALIALQWQVPTPPQVRAAAFRALAVFPGVKSLGAVEGGQALLISFPQEPREDWIELVVDPATSLVRSETNGKSTTRIEIAEWTNLLPRVVPLPPKTTCGG
jgi:hypothetical protein